MLLCLRIVCCITQGVFIERAAYVLYSLLLVECVCYTHMYNHTILLFLCYDGLCLLRKPRNAALTVHQVT